MTAARTRRVATVLAAAAASLIAVAARGEEPRFDPTHPFAAAKPGDWLEHRVATGPLQSVTRQFLAAASDDRRTIETTSEVRGTSREMRSVIETVEDRATRRVHSMRLKTDTGRVIDLSGMAESVRATMRAKDPFLAPAGTHWSYQAAEEISVPAGTFRCERFRAEPPTTTGPDLPATEIWVCPDLPLTGLVRMRTDGGIVMELAAHGRGGATAFKDD